MERNIHLHPVERARALGSSFRYRFQNPEKILQRYIKPGMTVLDLGCGTGFFTTAIARLLNNQGKVIAADVQHGMLDLLNHKIDGNDLKQVIQLHPCEEKSLNLTTKVDFILAFYSFHEMSYPDDIIRELKELLKPGGKIYIAEQKFHVTKSRFIEIVDKMKNNGFAITEKPKVFLSRAVVMTL